MRRSPRQDCLANIPSTITNQLPLKDLLRPNKVVSNHLEVGVVWRIGLYQKYKAEKVLGSSWSERCGLVWDGWSEWEWFWRGSPGGGGWRDWRLQYWLRLTEDVRRERNRHIWLPSDSWRSRTYPLILNPFLLWEQLKLEFFISLWLSQY